MNLKSMPLTSGGGSKINSSRNIRFQNTQTSLFQSKPLDILISCQDHLGWGGAAIAAQEFSSRLAAKHKVRLCFLNSLRRLTSESRIKIGKGYWGYQPFLGVPRTRSKYIYLTAGLGSQSGEFMKSGQSWRETIPEAQAAFHHADLIVCNSPYVLDVYKRTFGFSPKFSNFIFYDCLMCSTSAGLPFNRRDIDIVCAVSDWNRPGKGGDIAFKIRTVLGEKVKLFGLNGDGYTTRTSLLNILKRTKVVVIPSLFDASPNLLVEAMTAGANVIGTKNIGTWSWLHPDLIVENRELDSFLQKIEVALKEPRPGQLPDIEKHFQKMEQIIGL